MQATLKDKKIIPGNFWETLEISWENHGILSLRKSGNPDSSTSEYNFFVRIKRSDELRVPFNIGSQWSVSNSSKAICPN